MSLPGTVTSATRYVVHTHFTVQRQIPGLANIENRLQRLNRVINAVGRSFALIYAGVGLRRLAGAFISIHTEIEDARVGLAGLITAITGMETPRALQLAATAVEDLRKAAAQLPGELPQYLQALQVIYGPTRAAGGTMAQAKELAKLSVVAGYSLGDGARGARTLPLDVQQALTQGIGSYTTKYLNLLLSRVDQKYGQSSFFNQLPVARRLEIISEALGNMQEASKLLGLTFSAQSDTLRDNLREIGRQATGGLFEEFKSDLIEINTLYQDNTNAVNNWAGAIDKRLLISYLKLKMLALNPQVQGLVGAGTAMTAGAFAGRQVAQYGLGARIAAGVPGVGWLVAGITAIGAAMGNIMRKFPDETKMFVEALGRLGAAIGRLFGELTKFLLTNPAAEFVILGLLQALTDVIDATASFVGVLADLLHVINDLVDKVPEFTNPIGTDGAISPTRILRNQLDAFNEWVGLSGQPGDGTAIWPRGIFGRSYTRFPSGILGGPGARGAGDQRLENMMNLRTNLIDLDDLLPPQSELDERDIVGVGDVNLNGPIRIVIRAERVDNPDLVARSFREVAERAVEYRRGGRAGLVPKPG